MLVMTRILLGLDWSKVFHGMGFKIKNCVLQMSVVLHDEACDKTNFVPGVPVEERQEERVLFTASCAGAHTMSSCGMGE